MPAAIVPLTPAPVQHTAPPMPQDQGPATSRSEKSTTTAIVGGLRETWTQADLTPAPSAVSIIKADDVTIEHSAPPLSPAISTAPQTVTFKLAASQTVKPVLQDRAAASMAELTSVSEVKAPSPSAHVTLLCKEVQVEMPTPAAQISTALTPKPAPSVPRPTLVDTATMTTSKFEATELPVVVEKAGAVQHAMPLEVSKPTYRDVDCLTDISQPAIMHAITTAMHPTTTSLTEGISMKSVEIQSDLAPTAAPIAPTQSHFAISADSAKAPTQSTATMTSSNFDSMPAAIVPLTPAPVQHTAPPMPQDQGPATSRSEKSTTTAIVGGLRETWTQADLTPAPSAVSIIKADDVTIEHSAPPLSPAISTAPQTVTFKLAASQTVKPVLQDRAAASMAELTSVSEVKAPSPSAHVTLLCKEVQVEMPTPAAQISTALTPKPAPSVPRPTLVDTATMTTSKFEATELPVLVEKAGAVQHAMPLEVSKPTYRDVDCLTDISQPAIMHAITTAMHPTTTSLTEGISMKSVEIQSDLAPTAAPIAPTQSHFAISADSAKAPTQSTATMTSSNFDSMPAAIVPLTPAPVQHTAPPMPQDQGPATSRSEKSTTTAIVGGLRETWTQADLTPAPSAENIIKAEDVTIEHSAPPLSPAISTAPQTVTFKLAASQTVKPVLQDRAAASMAELTSVSEVKAPSPSAHVTLLCKEVQVEMPTPAAQISTALTPKPAPSVPRPTLVDTATMTTSKFEATELPVLVEKAGAVQHAMPLEVSKPTYRDVDCLTDISQPAIMHAITTAMHPTTTSLTEGISMKSVEIQSDLAPTAAPIAPTQSHFAISADSAKAPTQSTATMTSSNFDSMPAAIVPLTPAPVQHTAPPMPQDQGPATSRSEKSTTTAIVGGLRETWTQADLTPAPSAESIIKAEDVTIEHSAPPLSPAISTAPQTVTFKLAASQTVKPVLQDRAAASMAELTSVSEVKAPSPSAHVTLLCREVQVEMPTPAAQISTALTPKPAPSVPRPTLVDTATMTTSKFEATELPVLVEKAGAVQHAMPLEVSKPTYRDVDCLTDISQPAIMHAITTAMHPTTTSLTEGISMKSVEIQSDLAPTAAPIAPTQSHFAISADSAKAPTQSTATMTSSNFDSMPAAIVPLTPAPVQHTTPPMPQDQGPATSRSEKSTTTAIVGGLRETWTQADLTPASSAESIIKAEDVTIEHSAPPLSPAISTAPQTVTFKLAASQTVKPVLQDRAAASMAELTSVSEVKAPSPSAHVTLLCKEVQVEMPTPAAQISTALTPKPAPSVPRPTLVDTATMTTSKFEATELPVLVEKAGAVQHAMPLEVSKPTYRDVDCLTDISQPAIMHAITTAMHPTTTSLTEGISMKSVEIQSDLAPTAAPIAPTQSHFAISADSAKAPTQSTATMTSSNFDSMPAAIVPLTPAPVQHTAPPMPQDQGPATSRSEKSTTTAIVGGLRETWTQADLTPAPSAVSIIKAEDVTIEHSAPPLSPAISTAPQTVTFKLAASQTVKPVLQDRAAASMAELTSVSEVKAPSPSAHVTLLCKEVQVEMPTPAAQISTALTPKPAPSVPRPTLVDTATMTTSKFEATELPVVVEKAGAVQHAMPLEVSKPTYRDVDCLTDISQPAIMHAITTAMHPTTTSLTEGISMKSVEIQSDLAPTAAPIAPTQSHFAISADSAKAPTQSTATMTSSNFDSMPAAIVPLTPAPVQHTAPPMPQDQGPATSRSEKSTTTAIVGGLRETWTQADLTPASSAVSIIKADDVTIEHSAPPLSPAISTAPQTVTFKLAASQTVKPVLQDRAAASMAELTSVSEVKAPSPSAHVTLLCKEVQVEMPTPAAQISTALTPKPAPSVPRPTLVDTATMTTSKFEATELPVVVEKAGAVQHAMPLEVSKPTYRDVDCLTDISQPAIMHAITTAMHPTTTSLTEGISMKSVEIQSDLAPTAAPIAPTQSHFAISADSAKAPTQSTATMTSSNFDSMPAAIVPLTPAPVQHTAPPMPQDQGPATSRSEKSTTTAIVGGLRETWTQADLTPASSAVSIIKADDVTIEHSAPPLSPAISTAPQTVTFKLAASQTVKPVLQDRAAASMAELTSVSEVKAPSPSAHVTLLCKEVQVEMPTPAAQISTALTPKPAPSVPRPTLVDTATMTTSKFEATELPVVVEKAGAVQHAMPLEVSKPTYRDVDCLTDISQPAIMHAITTAMHPTTTSLTEGISMKSVEIQSDLAPTAAPIAPTQSHFAISADSAKAPTQSTATMTSSNFDSMPAAIVPLTPAPVQHTAPPMPQDQGPATSRSEKSTTTAIVGGLRETWTQADLTPASSAESIIKAEDVTIEHSAPPLSPAISTAPQTVTFKLAASQTVKPVLQDRAAASMAELTSVSEVKAPSPSAHVTLLCKEVQVEMPTPAAQISTALTPKPAPSVPRPTLVDTATMTTSKFEATELPVLVEKAGAVQHAMPLEVSKPTYRDVDCLTDISQPAIMHAITTAMHPTTTSLTEGISMKSVEIQSDLAPTAAPIAPTQSHFVISADSAKAPTQSTATMTSSNFDSMPAAIVPLTPAPVQHTAPPMPQDQGPATSRSEKSTTTAIVGGLRETWTQADLTPAPSAESIIKAEDVTIEHSAPPLSPAISTAPQTVTFKLAASQTVKPVLQDRAAASMAELTSVSEVKAPSPSAHVTLLCKEVQVEMPTPAAQISTALTPKPAPSVPRPTLVDTATMTTSKFEATELPVLVEKAGAVQHAMPLEVSKPTYRDVDCLTDISQPAIMHAITTAMHPTTTSLTEGISMKSVEIQSDLAPTAAPIAPTQSHFAISADSAKAPTQSTATMTSSNFDSMPAAIVPLTPAPVQHTAPPMPQDQGPATSRSEKSTTTAIVGGLRETWTQADLTPAPSAESIIKAEDVTIEHSAPPLSPAISTAPQTVTFKLAASQTVKPVLQDRAAASMAELTSVSEVKAPSPSAHVTLLCKEVQVEMPTPAAQISTALTPKPAPSVPRPTLVDTATMTTSKFEATELPVLVEKAGAVQHAMPLEVSKPTYRDVDCLTDISQPAIMHAITTAMHPTTTSLTEGISMKSVEIQSDLAPTAAPIAPTQSHFAISADSAKAPTQSTATMTSSNFDSMPAAIVPLTPAPVQHTTPPMPQDQGPATSRSEKSTTTAIVGGLRETWTQADLTPAPSAESIIKAEDVTIEHSAPPLSPAISTAPQTVTFKLAASQTVKPVLQDRAAASMAELTSVSEVKAPSPSAHVTLLCKEVQVEMPTPAAQISTALTPKPAPSVPRPTLVDTATMTTSKFEATELPVLVEKAGAVQHAMPLEVSKPTYRDVDCLTDISQPAIMHAITTAMHPTTTSLTEGISMKSVEIQSDLAPTAAPIAPTQSHFAISADSAKAPTQSTATMTSSNFDSMPAAIVPLTPAPVQHTAPPMPQDQGPATSRSEKSTTTAIVGGLRETWTQADLTPAPSAESIIKAEDVTIEHSAPPLSPAISTAPQTVTFKLAASQTVKPVLQDRAAASMAELTSVSEVKAPSPSAHVTLLCREVQVEMPTPAAQISTALTPKPAPSVPRPTLVDTATMTTSKFEATELPVLVEKAGAVQHAMPLEVSKPTYRDVDCLTDISQPAIMHAITTAMHPTTTSLTEGISMKSVEIQSDLAPTAAPIAPTQSHFAISADSAKAPTQSTATMTSSNFDSMPAAIVPLTPAPVQHTAPPMPQDQGPATSRSEKSTTTAIVGGLRETWTQADLTPAPSAESIIKAEDVTIEHSAPPLSPAISTAPQTVTFKLAASQTVKPVLQDRAAASMAELTSVSEVKAPSPSAHVTLLCKEVQVEMPTPAAQISTALTPKPAPSVPRPTLVDTATMTTSKFEATELPVLVEKAGAVQHAMPLEVSKPTYRDVDCLTDISQPAIMHAITTAMHPTTTSLTEGISMKSVEIQSDLAPTAAPIAPTQSHFAISADSAKAPTQSTATMTSSNFDSMPAAIVPLTPAPVQHTAPPMPQDQGPATSRSEKSTTTAIVGGLRETWTQADLTPAPSAESIIKAEDVTIEHSAPPLSPAISTAPQTVTFKLAASQTVKPVLQDRAAASMAELTSVSEVKAPSPSAHVTLLCKEVQVEMPTPAAQISTALTPKPAPSVPRPTLVDTATMTTSKFEATELPVLVEKAGAVQHAMPLEVSKPTYRDVDCLTDISQPAIMHAITTAMHPTTTSLTEGISMKSVEIQSDLAPTAAPIAPTQSHFAISADSAKAPTQSTATMTSSNFDSMPAAIVPLTPAPVQHTAPPMPQDQGSATSRSEKSTTTAIVGGLRETWTQADLTPAPSAESIIKAEDVTIEHSAPPLSPAISTAPQTVTFKLAASQTVKPVLQDRAAASMAELTSVSEVKAPSPSAHVTLLCKEVQVEMPTPAAQISTALTPKPAPSVPRPTLVDTATMTTSKFEATELPVLVEKAGAVQHAMPLEVSKPTYRDVDCLTDISQPAIMHAITTAMHPTTTSLTEGISMKSVEIQSDLAPTAAPIAPTQSHFAISADSAKAPTQSTATMTSSNFDSMPAAIVPLTPAPVQHTAPPMPQDQGPATSRSEKSTTTAIVGGLRETWTQADLTPAPSAESIIKAEDVTIEHSAPPLSPAISTAPQTVTFKLAASQTVKPVLQDRAAASMAELTSVSEVKAPSPSAHVTLLCKEVQVEMPTPAAQIATALTPKPAPSVPRPTLVDTATMTTSKFEATELPVLVEKAGAVQHAMPLEVSKPTYRDVDCLTDISQPAIMHAITTAMHPTTTSLTEGISMKSVEIQSDLAPTAAPIAPTQSHFAISADSAKAPTQSTATMTSSNFDSMPAAIVPLTPAPVQHTAPPMPQDQGPATSRSEKSTTTAIVGGLRETWTQADLTPAPSAESIIKAEDVTIEHSAPPLSPAISTAPQTVTFKLAASQTVKPVLQDRAAASMAELTSISTALTPKPAPSVPRPTLVDTATMTTSKFEATELPVLVEKAGAVQHAMPLEVSKPTYRDVDCLTDISQPAIMHAITTAMHPTTTSLTEGISMKSVEIQSDLAPTAAPIAPTQSHFAISADSAKAPTQSTATMTSSNFDSMPAAIVPLTPAPVQHTAPPMPQDQGPATSRSEKSTTTAIVGGLRETWTQADLTPAPSAESIIKAEDVTIEHSAPPLSPAISTAPQTVKFKLTASQTVKPLVQDRSSLTMSAFSDVSSHLTASKHDACDDFAWQTDFDSCLLCVSSSLSVYSRSRSIQCDLEESVSSLDLVNSLDVTRVESDLRYYSFSTSSSVSSQTERLPLSAWMVFDSSAGFLDENDSAEFYDLVDHVKQTIIHVSDRQQFSELLKRMDFDFLNYAEYNVALEQRFLREVALSVVPQSPSDAEVGIQTMESSVVSEPFTIEQQSEIPAEFDLSSNYSRRVQLGQLVETSTKSSPYLEIISVQTECTCRHDTPDELITVKPATSVVFSAPPKEVEESLYRVTQESTKHTEAEVVEETHMLEKPLFVADRVQYTMLSRAVQTEESDAEFITGKPKVRKPAGAQPPIECLHDLDVTTYFFDEDVYEEEYLRRTQDSSSAVSLLQRSTDYVEVDLRQRITEYELCDMVSPVDALCWNDIREVASPITGLFAPVNVAVRRGWLRMGHTNEYVDPTTGHSIPLETALAQGRIRLGSTTANTSNSCQNDHALMLIEREFCELRRVRATSVLNTYTLEYLPVRQAQADLLLSEENGICCVYDVQNARWMTAEEAVGNRVLLLDESEGEEIDWKRSEHAQTNLRVYRIEAIQPGGEPADWLTPEEATEMQLFNPSTGEVAIDWPARPEYGFTVRTNGVDRRYTATQWCSFLTARQAGWLRLRPEPNAQLWIPLSEPGPTTPGRRLLSTKVKLISSVNESTRSQNYQQRFEKESDSEAYEMSIGRRFRPQRVRPRLDNIIAGAGGSATVQQQQSTVSRTEEHYSSIQRKE
ncbi:hypothetical protein SprV_0100279800 [Sparganum proliferum]